MVIIKKTMNPTTTLSCITNVPKALTTSPGLPSARISLVDDIFSESRNTVVINSNEGKMENCNASLVYTVFNRIITDSEILSANNISSNVGGTGIIMIKTMAISNIATLISPNFTLFPPLTIMNTPMQNAECTMHNAELYT